MYHVLFWLIWSRGPWTPSDQDHLDRFSDQITLCSVSVFHNSVVTSDDLSRIARKTVFGVYDQARHKPSCTVAVYDFGFRK